MNHHNTTTDLETIRTRPNRFTWGRVITIHDIGRYTLVEYVSQSHDKPSVVYFHSYVDGKSTHSSQTSLESGLICAIAAGSIDDANEPCHMARAACKVLDIKW